MTDQKDIKRWLDEGQKKGASHVIVATDTFDHTDYPVYVIPPNAIEIALQSAGGDFTRIQEVYNLAMPIAAQLREVRAFNLKTVLPEKEVIIGRPLYWVLDTDGQTPVPTNSMERAARIRETENWIVAKHCIHGNRVSTVFLGVDMGWHKDLPTLWETMIFDESGNEFMENYTVRYTNYADAVEGHAQAIEFVIAHTQ